MKMAEVRETESKCDVLAPGTRGAVSNLFNGATIRQNRQPESQKK